MQGSNSKVKKVKRLTRETFDSPGLPLGWGSYFLHPHRSTPLWEDETVYC